MRLLVDRSPNTGIIEGVSKLFSKELSLELFRKMCFVRNFERYIEQIYTPEIFKPPLYLSVGQEAVDAALSLSFTKPKIFAQHRCHGIYLSYGADPRALVDELLGLPTGCAKGMGGSASIHSPEINMDGHDGFMGTQIPIAVGHAMATGKKTLAVMGDASVEEGFVLEALGFAATKKPPVLFVCTDNGLSCLTPTCVRRNWNTVEHATFGMPAVEITDDPWLIMYWVQQFEQRLPAFINIQTCRESSHANFIKDWLITPEWNRYQLVKNELEHLGLGCHIPFVEESTEEQVKGLWQSRLEASRG
ncbi:MAG: hypothetical protein HYZ69_03935 [Candidatus Colwellbacteria bacterium]|nr:hypothetical protein [Candidatus Colwellbacteria bacterium]